MSINYVVRKKVDKSGDKEVVRYYAAGKVLQAEPVSNDEIAQKMAERSSLMAGDALSVLEQLPVVIAEFMSAGRTVNIRGLGNFYPSLTSEPVERVEDCTADKVRVSRICFKASSDLLRRFQRYLSLISLQVQEVKKGQRKQGKE
ncbi:MAG: DNA-binding protein [Bacteroides sp.]|nr:DNA-binding protein [Bacteroides sp.]